MKQYPATPSGSPNGITGLTIEGGRSDLPSLGRKGAQSLSFLFSNLILSANIDLYYRFLSRVIFF